MTESDRIAPCSVCDGYGWYDDDEAQDAAGAECRFCSGIGYVLRDLRGVERAIPDADLPALSAQLEALEVERLRAIGYTGQAKQPWQQRIRIERGDRIAVPPPSADADANDLDADDTDADAGIAGSTGVLHP